MSDTSATASGPFDVLRDLFGDYRAEWPPERFRELFVEPAYFKKLESMRPSLLMGGRGTGKTTALRSLRFDATLERLEAQGRGYGDQEHLGIFIRVNKNRVHAFQGAALDTAIWTKAFAHYFNLLTCLELTELAAWLEQRAGQTLSPSGVHDVCRDLAVPLTSTTSDLRRAIKAAISELQIFVNNPGYSPRPLFSMAEAPVRAFALTLRDQESLIDERTIFCCIDEYENLLDDQQAVLNTYIKHAEPPLSYKVGVRKNGLRNHCTLEGADLLRTPDDYEQIDIAQEGFEFFAKAVAELRLNRARSRGVPVSERLEGFLDDLSLSEEAQLLGADEVADRILAELRDVPSLYEPFSRKPKTETCFLQYWAKSENRTVREMAEDWLAHGQAWKTRLNNYGYASLFWLSQGRKGARIRKYYCGARTLLALPGGNIRYFLELVDNAIVCQLNERNDHATTPLKISAKAQTVAARAVGQRRIEQLEGLADRGVQLKRLVLAIGKVFFELARTPLGRTPEVTSFVLSGEGEERQRAAALLNEGVACLAFEATPRTKATTNLEMRDDEYRLHPIFCAFFEISHRRKRRMTFKPSDLLLVLEQPSQAISQLLEGAGQTVEDELPEQLALFTSFFLGGASP